MKGGGTTVCLVKGSGSTCLLAGLAVGHGNRSERWVSKEQRNKEHCDEAGECFRARPLTQFVRISWMISDLQKGGWTILWLIYLNIFEECCSQVIFQWFCCHWRPWDCVVQTRQGVAAAAAAGPGQLPQWPRWWTVVGRFLGQQTDAVRTLCTSTPILPNRWRQDKHHSTSEWKQRHFLLYKSNSELMALERERANWNSDQDTSRKVKILGMYFVYVCIQEWVAWLVFAKSEEQDV